MDGPQSAHGHTAPLLHCWEDNHEDSVAHRSAHIPLYLDTVESVDRFFGSIAGTPDLALDTEGASFHRFVDRIYLLQLSTREQSAILDPLAVSGLADLGALLEDPAVQVVLHDADYDLRLLDQDYGWHVRNIFDTRIAAQLLGQRAFGLAALLERYFGMKLDKKHQRADWSMRPLTPGMLAYAAQDTMYLLELRDRLKEELKGKGRWEWAIEEFRLLEGTKWTATEGSAAFLRVKGARDLTRHELAILRELVPWRDELARVADRATFRIIGNDQLLDIARTKPGNREELAAVKGMPRGLLDSKAADMLAAVQRGVAVPEAELPRFPKPQRWDRDPDFDGRVSALKTVRDAAAQRLELDPGVLCSRDRLEAVARRMPTSLGEIESIPELRRWQVRELGRDFLHVLVSHHAAARRNANGGETELVMNDTEESPYRD